MTEQNYQAAGDERTGRRTDRGFRRDSMCSRPGEPAVQNAGREPGAGEDYPDLCFPRTAHLLQHSAFERVYKEGRRIFSGNMTVFFRPRPDGDGAAGPRIGFTVSRAFGGAVRRNRIRRRLREAVRMNLAGLNEPVDVVINPKRTPREAEFTTLTHEVARAFRQIGERLAGAADKGSGA